MISNTADRGLHLLRRKNASLDSDPQRRLTNVLYYGTMQLGTPGQDITVCPDTSSAAIWTSATNTPPAASGNSKIAPSYNGFVSNASSSFEVDCHHTPLSCHHPAFASMCLHAGMACKPQRHALHVTASQVLALEKVPECAVSPCSPAADLMLCCAARQLRLCREVQQWRGHRHPGQRQSAAGRCCARQHQPGPGD